MPAVLLFKLTEVIIVMMYQTKYLVYAFIAKQAIVENWISTYFLCKYYHYGAITYALEKKWQKQF